MEPHEMEQQIMRQLAPTERLLWNGQPAQGIMFRPSDAVAIPFSLMSIGIAIFWEVGAASSHDPFFFRLWGIPFVLGSLHIVIGRFFTDAIQRSKTVYGLTNERVIIVTGLFTRTVKSIVLASIKELSLSEKSDGTGTITLGAQNVLWSPTPSVWGGRRSQLPSPALEGIAGVRPVYEQIRQAQMSA